MTKRKAKPKKKKPPAKPGGARSKKEAKLEEAVFKLIRAL